MIIESSTVRHDHVHNYMQNQVTIVVLPYGFQRRQIKKHAQQQPLWYSCIMVIIIIRCFNMLMFLSLVNIKCVG